MKQLPALVLLLLLASLRFAAAQPSIYTIPDIGTPGMNTYVEIIAPVTETGKFLQADGLIPPAQLNIHFIVPADSNRIKVSPGVISWNQRLVTFQFFVTPNATLGPVPMQLNVNGTLFDLDTFYIVAPQRFGTKSGGGVIGSSPTYGTGFGQRSKRGAMIVDSLILGNGTYTIDITDRDPVRAGNQGYLPCIIMSKGRISISSGANISVSAPKGLDSKNAGPGGGGGGGYGADRPPTPPILVTIPGERDVPLGNGYTGGQSSVLLVPSPGGFGQGSGQGAASLNGAAANDKFSLVANTTVRLFAGGPGHPFDNDGRSGGAAVATGNAPPNFVGVYFGGGGNGSEASGLPQAQDAFNGQVIGNIELEPLHGGGGGSSGGSGDSVGGGGGGALALYSAMDAVVDNAEAHGGDGRNGCDNCGIGSGDASAGGAGGSIIIGGKNGLSIGTIDVEGGAAGQKAASASAGSTSGNGGGGRFRSDGRLAGFFSLVPDISQYAGPTIDTLTVATAATWTIHGAGRYQPRGGGDSILVFVRGENSGWNFYTPYRTRVNSDSSWKVDVTFPSDSIAYVCAVQVTPEPELAVATPYTRVPTHIFSQSAANIVRLRLQAPAITAPSSRRLDTLFCPGILYDTFAVANSGTGPLIVGGTTAFVGGGAAYYQIVEPRLPDTVPPSGSHRWIVRFNGLLAPNGPAGTVLRLQTNDPAHLQWDIAYTEVQKVTQPPAASPATVAFGNVSLGDRIQRTMIITNPAGSPAQTIGGVTVAPPNPQIRILAPTIPPARTLAPGDTMRIVLEYTPTTKGALAGTSLAVQRTAPCSDTSLYPITGSGISASIIASRDPVRLVDSNCNARAIAEDTVTLINKGTINLFVSNVAIAPATFTVIPPSPTYATTPIPPGGSMKFTLRYSPAVRGTVSGTLTVTSTDPNRPSFTVDVLGSSDSVVIRPLQRDVQFRTLVSCETSADTTIQLVNTWGDTVTLLPVNIDQPFQLKTVPPYVILPGDTFSIRVSFAPAADGFFSAPLTYTSTPCGRVDTIMVHGDRVPQSFTVGNVAFGNVTAGGTSTLGATVTNTGPLQIRVSGARIVPATPELSIPAAQFPIRVAAAGSAQISITYAPLTTSAIPAGTHVVVDVDSLCSTSDSGTVAGHGIPGGVSLSRGLLAFGDLLACQSTLDTFTISNVSQIPVTLSAPVFVNGGAAFSIAGGTFAAGPLANGFSSSLVVLFSPGAGPDAAFLDTLRITSSDPLRPVIDVPLSGRRVSQSAALISAGFPQVAAGSSATVAHWIVNTGSAPMRIDGITVGAPFSVTSTTPQLPVLLAPGDSLRVDLAFAPQTPGAFVDSLRVARSIECDSLVLGVSGEGIDAVVLAGALWEDVAGNPGDIVHIPLRLNTDVAAAGVTSYTVSASFNPTLLLPTGIVTQGTLSNGWNVAAGSSKPGEYHFTANGAAPLSGTGVLAYLEARVMLGDTTATSVATTDSVQLNSPTAKITIAPGVFTLTGYCTNGGQRLLIRGGSGLKAVRPNPVRDEAQVLFDTPERGATSLRLFDALGRPVATLLDALVTPGTYIVTLQTSALPAGVYYLELRTPGTHDRMSVVVNR
ncbi:MAG: choice-of-anchor D domain-containing protein [Bacteroidetes bacterium]|nr:choice-of-anchor D domain-containing protein [Bacteroidota bacterium]